MYSAEQIFPYSLQLLRAEITDCRLHVSSEVGHEGYPSMIIHTHPPINTT